MKLIIYLLLAFTQSSVVKFIGGDWLLTTQFFENGEIETADELQQWYTDAEDDAKPDEYPFRFVGKYLKNETQTSDGKVSAVKNLEEKYVNIVCTSENSGRFETGVDTYYWETLFEFYFNKQLNGDYLSTGEWFGEFKGQYMMLLRKNSFSITVFPSEKKVEKTIVYLGKKVDHTPPKAWWEPYLPSGIIVLFLVANLYIKMVVGPSWDAPAPAAVENTKPESSSSSTRSKGNKKRR